MNFVLGLLLTPVFAVALLFSLAMTFILVKDVIEARGDWDTFEAQTRHYSDGFDVAADGSLLVHRAAHPVASFLAMVAGSWVVAGLAWYVLERLRRKAWSSA